MGSQTHIWEPLGATNGSIKFRGVDFMGLVAATVDLPVTNFEIWTRKAKTSIISTEMGGFKVMHGHRS